MTDETNNTDNEPELTQEEIDAKLDAGPSRKDALMEKARAMQISFSPNIGEDTLAQRIAEREAEIAAQNAPKPPPAAAEVAAPVSPAPQPMAVAAPAAPKYDPNVPRASDIPHISKLLKMSQEEILEYPPALRTRIIRARQRHEGMRLLRCQIHNNNPAKNDLKGEIISVSNKYIGVVRKFIPFGEATENGYHVPAILVDNLRRRKYQKVMSVKQPDGTERVSTTLAPEYTIVVLDPLTPEELSKMAQRQAAIASVGFVGA